MADLPYQRSRLLVGQAGLLEHHRDVTTGPGNLDGVAGGPPLVGVGRQANARPQGRRHGP